MVFTMGDIESECPGVQQEGTELVSEPAHGIWEHLQISVPAVAAIGLVAMWRAVVVVVMADSMVMVGFGSGMDANKIRLWVMRCLRSIKDLQGLTKDDLVVVIESHVRNTSLYSKPSR